MNAGRDYKKAKATAQANANWTGTPRYLHMWQGDWWISKEPGGGAMQASPREEILPRDKTTSHRRTR